MDSEIQQMEQLIGSPIPFVRSKNSGSTVYFQLAKSIQEQIEKGKLTAGTRLPSERKISTLNNLSLATVRKAFEELVQKEFIHRIQGKGTFVNSSSDRLKKIRFYSFADDFESEQFITDFVFLGLKIIKGNQKIWNYLKLRKGQELFELRRLILLKGKPHIYCISYISRRLMKGLEKYSQKDIERGPIYIFFENEFNIPTINHIELFSVALAEGDVAAQMKINEGHPLLKIEKLIFTHQKKPFEYRKSYCVTANAFKMRKVWNPDNHFR